VWPFRKRESSYTEIVSNAIWSAITGTTDANALATAALETCAGIYSRAFASARVLPTGAASDALGPDVLGAIGRALARRGEWLALIDVDSAGRLRLLPASSWTVQGDAEPESWRYRVYLPGPSRARERRVPAEGVVHCRYAYEASRPWRGMSPLEFAVYTGRLAGGLEQGMANEAGKPTAYVVPTPLDGKSPALADLRTDIKGAKGGTAFVETFRAGLGEGIAAAPQQDWTPRRLGINTPAANVTLRNDVEAAILGAYGIHPALAQANSDGTAQREAFRRLLHLTIAPLGRIVAHELAVKLESPGLRLNFTALNAGDVSGRSRAYRSLIGPEGGMDPERAEEIAGFE